MRKGFPSHCFQGSGYRIRGCSQRLSGLHPEHGSLGLTCSFLFPFYFFGFVDVRSHLDELLGKISLKKHFKKEQNWGCAADKHFCHVGKDNTGNKCSITQVCPGRFLDHDHQLLCSSYKRCALEMAISRQAPIIFNCTSLIYQLGASFFSSDKYSTRNKKKLKSAAFLMQWVMLPVSLMSAFSPSDKTH